MKEKKDRVDDALCATRAAIEEGMECQIDKSIPASSYRSADGQAFFYTYDVFIDKSFEGNIPWV